MIEHTRHIAICILVLPLMAVVLLVAVVVATVAMIADEF